MPHNQLGGDRIELSLVQDMDGFHCRYGGSFACPTDRGGGFFRLLYPTNLQVPHIPAGISYSGPLPSLSPTSCLLAVQSYEIFSSFQHRRIGVQATETKRGVDVT